MRLGISSWAFQWLAGQPNHIPDEPLTPLGLLDKAGELGVSVVQIADNMPLHTFPPDVIQAFIETAHTRNVTVELGARGIETHHLHTYLDLAKRLGSTVVRVSFPPPDDAQSAVAQIQSVAPDFEAAGVYLAFENYDHFSVRDLVKIIEAVDSPNVGGCVDPGNSLSANEDTERVVDILGPYAFNLHVKDFAIFREPYKMGFIVQGRPCGQGQLDFVWLLKRMKELNRDVNAILECWTPWQGSLHESLAVENEWITESIRYLRRLITD